MLTLATLGAIDWRSRIYRVPQNEMDDRLKVRYPAKTSVTWHYNGPPIAGVENWSLDRLFKFINEIDIPNHIARIGADSLQYHLVFAPDGSVLQTQDLDRLLWHCANWDGNHWSVACHFPLGGTQGPTPPQLATAKRVTDQLITAFGMKNRSVVLGHKEWPGAATLCPGDVLGPILKEWRSHPVGSDTNVPVPSTSGLMILSAPRITQQQFDLVLYNGTTNPDPNRKTPYSPAYVERTDIWNILVAKGIDPAVFLAFFHHENQYGTAGITAKYNLRNPGSVRSPVHQDGVREIVQTEIGPFVAYWTWAAAAKDWADRMLERYIAKGNDTVEKAVPIYAPDGPPDYNNSKVYINSVLSDVNRWAYRKDNLVYRVASPDGANLRQGTSTTSKIVRMLPTGFQFEVSEISFGQSVNGDNRWAHLLSGEGFISLTTLVQVV